VLVLAYVKKNVSFCYKHPEDMIRIVDVGFLWPQHFNKIVRETTCGGCFACVTFFLHETSLLLVSLFYGKYYVTMFIREYVAFSYRYWGKFLFKMRRNCLESCFFIENVGFYFSFVFESIFFFERFFPLHFIFFLGRQWLDGFYWFCDLLFFS